MYAPVVRSARATRRYEWDHYEGAFLDNIVAEGEIGYEFIIVVFEKDMVDPFLFVASERNSRGSVGDLFRELGIEMDVSNLSRGESHFLCLFDSQGHHNLGDSNEWSDARRFEAAALELLTKKLGAMPIVNVL